MPYTNCEIGMLFETVKQKTEGSIDDQTWKDLDLKAYCAKLTLKVSILGQQAIHLRLRQGKSDPDASVINTRYGVLMSDSELRNDLAKTLKPLRGMENEMSNLLFGDLEIETPLRERSVLSVQIIILLSMISALFSLTLLLPLVFFLLFAFVAQASWLPKVERFDPKLAGLRCILNVACELSDLAKTRGSSVIHDFIVDFNQIEICRKGLSRSILERALPGAELYADWFFLRNIQCYFKAAKIIRQNRRFLQRCYIQLADLEADLALANHMIQSDFCWARQHSGNRVTLIDVVNPLLTGAEPVTFATDGKSVFLSGQNGSGKSTFLRTLGLNLVVGRAFGFCYASKADIPMGLVYTSIQIEDSMANGESLYIAELRRARELLESSTGAHAGIYIVDEIFQGTNHLESVSAAAAFIHKLSRNALTVVSSHNLILAALLGKWLTPMQVTSIAGDIRLSPGVLDHPNGIALLAASGFDEDISVNAARVSAWLSSYLSHPKDCPALLKE